MGGNPPPDATEPPSDADDPRAKHLQHLISISGAGDMVLCVTFLTSSATLRRTRKAALRSRASEKDPSSSALAPTITVPYRVCLASLTRSSHYFSNLLANPSFGEAQLISSAHAALAARGVDPAEADPLHLPWVGVTDDDEATQSARRQEPLGDMLRIMHDLPVRNPRVVMSYVATLAIIADRFDATAVVARGLAGLRFKWPLTSTLSYTDERGHPTEVEAVLRQKILLSWLLNQPLRLHRESRELITRGSMLWGAHPPDPEPDDMSAVWWHLPDGIEEELQHRRSCILNTIASIQNHFLARYSSRHRQCKLGYDSSPACDAFQLGQMLKFLLSRDLLALADYSSSSQDTLPNRSALNIDDLLFTLKQCPAYQVDKNHLNCGPRIRIDPIVDYVKAMLTSSVVSIPLADWTRKRHHVSWVAGVQAKEGAGRGRDGADGGRRVFSFTRALASDQRLRYEGAMYADGMARMLFTADAWDWTPED